MGLSSTKLQPQELVTFKKLPTSVPLDNIEIPERPDNRRATNVKWLIFLGVFVLVLLPFLIYTLIYADTRRLMGYDKCGNICGDKNYHWDGIDCSGADMTSKPFLQYEGDRDVDSDYRQRQCVAECSPGYDELFGNCYKKSQPQKKYKQSVLKNVQSEDSEKLLDQLLTDFNPPKSNKSSVKVIKAGEEETTFDFGVYFDDVKWQLIVSCLLSVLISMGMLFLFRYAVAFVVWGILIGCFIAFTVLVIGAWYLYGITKAPQRSSVLISAIVLTLIAVLLGIVLIWCRKKIRLVILLLKETTKAVFAMPGLIGLPVLSLFAITIITVLFGVTTFYMTSSGTLSESFRQGFYVYQHNPVMALTMGYNFVVYLWLTQFFTGIQYMVIAGAVSKWYFSRDKSLLSSPIGTSFAVAFKYHLGSVAFGSLIITFVALIKGIILSLIKNERARKCMEDIVDAIESFFKFLSKNSYIITAMHGQAFLRSGKRAAKLIFQNLGDIIAVNYIGDFVLGMAKLLIIVLTMLISVGIFTVLPNHYGWTNIWAYVIIGVISVIVACVSFGVFETTIDTIFICYCEDNLMNDGMARPYYMSRNLMEFVQDSKDIYGLK